MAIPATLAGRCANGNERDQGRVVHAVPADATGKNIAYYARSLCGKTHGARSAGWVPRPDLLITCARCRKLQGAAAPDDFTLANHGSLLLLTPQTPAAKQWVAEHLAHPETQTWCGGTVIEPRYWPDIEGGIADDGLTVQEA
jgi:hypothetical protein